MHRPRMDLALQIGNADGIRGGLGLGASMLEQDQNLRKSRSLGIGICLLLFGATWENGEIGVCKENLYYTFDILIQ